MSMERPPSHAELVRFVRETLGCSCPDDVLARIEFSPGDPPVLYRLDVSGRLLVHLADENAVAGPDALIGLLRAGKAERDAMCFNRFRLALVSDDIEICASRALGMLSPAKGLLELAGIAGLDERVHLHVIRRGRLF